MSSKKNPKRDSNQSKEIIVKDELSCQIMYAQESVTSLSIDSISIHPSGLKALGIKNGAYVYVTSKSSLINQDTMNIRSPTSPTSNDDNDNNCKNLNQKCYIFSIWSSPTLPNNTTVLMNSKLKISFPSEKIILSTSPLLHCRILPCTNLICLCENIYHSNQIITYLKDYIKSIVINTIIINDLKLEISWQGSKIILYLKPNITHMDTDNQFIDFSKTIGYQIHTNTIFEFQTNNTANKNDTNNNNDMRTLVKPAGYDYEINTALQFIQSGLGLLSPHNSKNNNNNNNGNNNNGTANASKNDVVNTNMENTTTNSTTTTTTTTTTNTTTTTSTTTNNNNSNNNNKPNLLPNIFIENISKPPRGLLIKSTPGAGKTYIMKYIVSQLSILNNSNNNNNNTSNNNSNTSIDNTNNTINTSTTISTVANINSCKVQIYITEITPRILLFRNTNEMELKLTKLFQKAIQNAPSCIVFDDIDLIAPSRSNDMPDSHKRLVSCLLRLIDQTYDFPVVFIGK